MFRKPALLNRKFFLPSLQAPPLSLTRIALQIHFYMPENCLPPAEERAAWMSGTPTRLEQSGKAASVQCWIYLTYARLRNSGLPVQLVHQFPSRGIVVALTGNIPPGYQVPEEIFLVGVVADGVPHPSAHFHVLQNAAHANRLPNSCYLPHWPQPGLIPRDPDRGDRFENLVFFGDPRNLAPELRDPDFASRIREKFGIEFRAAESDRWHDYSEVDAVLAIRAFGSKSFLRKPASKLYNAWQAEAPFLGGADSAFSSHGCPGLNYLRCTSLGEVEAALSKLRNDIAFRRRMVREGRLATEAFLPGKVFERWAAFLAETAGRTAPAFFTKGRASRKVYEFSQRAILAADRLRGGY
jgi:hypothetical protein